MAMAETVLSAQHFAPPSPLPPLQDEKDKVSGSIQPNSSDGATDPGWEDGQGCDTRNLYPGILPESAQTMYFSTAYLLPHQSTYCSQPQGPYVSNGGALTHGNGPQKNLYYYQQHPPPSGMQYYPTEQEVPKLGMKKATLKDAGQNQKPKLAGTANKQGYQANHRNLAPSETCNQWEFYPGVGNGNFYGPPSGYDYYSQQWHSSAQGFQPIPPPQNLGLHGNCIPPVPNGGLGQYQSFPSVHFAQNHSGRVSKGSSIKGGIVASNWRAKETSKNTNKVEQPSNNTLNEAFGDQSSKSLVVKTNACLSMVQKCYDVGEPTNAMQGHDSYTLNRSNYNKEDFQVSYESAKFFVIKSYSEDDVHKSIKYNVWSSTPNGNKRLDEAFRKAQEKSESVSSPCPIFFFFSVNCSGQFCGVAEMVGSVDFSKNMDFWLQGKWNGCLHVKWHIIKDVPNGHFRHIILANNENKPVTHSRDTQEVHFHQGLEMLKIFKFFPTRTSLLDDFAFYDSRQKVLQERKSKQQQRLQVVKQMKDQTSVRNGGNNVVEAAHSPAEDGLVAKEVEVGNHVEENGIVTMEVESDVAVEAIESKVAELKFIVDDNKDDSKSTAVLEKDVQKVIEKGALEKDVRKVVENGATTAELKTLSIATDKNTTKILNVEGEKRGKSRKVVDPETQAMARKDDMSRVPINYKKALLEGIQAKVNVPDQAIGA